MSDSATLRVQRGNTQKLEFEDFQVPLEEGMVVLDALHWIQANADPSLACRWNCKAGKCGSCSVEINGRPKLACMTGFHEIDVEKPVYVTPLRAFPVITDLVADVSWNYRAKQSVKGFSPRPQTEEERSAGGWRMQQRDIDRVQEFRKCIECFLCQDVCHVLRASALHQEFVGPRLLIHAAALEMHPLDNADRRSDLRESHGIGFCNITKCCTDVCPEGIKITDNAIIPLKERVADDAYDPVRKLLGLLTGNR
ncbi:MAG: succinate dehydrogenase/fumarate reductase iron-sulfur subunit [Chloroflexi bacterium]|nr:succinate dehydrogenase/fumarate reductase iron-sulfur subunit [Chloroflexota bacterium]MDE2703231.1 succinate dehydrogenase/fumarate reductase iron-sulfur subunit [Chloroflexota bacterium]MXX66361.1 succinate dehydrogenase/fumarate reductase iron-sulfur subunit [Chloroflexota bacterium]